MNVPILLFTDSNMYAKAYGMVANEYGVETLDGKRDSIVDLESSFLNNAKRFFFQLTFFKSVCLCTCVVHIHLNG